MKHHTITALLVLLATITNLPPHTPPGAFLWFFYFCGGVGGGWYGVVGGWVED